MTAARTITLSAFEINGVPTGTYTVPAYAFPPKRVAEVGIFSVDFGPALDTGDAIVAAAVTILPDTPGCVGIMSRTASGTVVSATLTGGQPGTTYAVTMSAATVGQSLYPATVQLQVIS